MLLSCSLTSRFIHLRPILDNVHSSQADMARHPEGHCSNLTLSAGFYQYSFRKPPQTTSSFPLLLTPRQPLSCLYLLSPRTLGFLTAPPLLPFSRIDREPTPSRPQNPFSSTQSQMRKVQPCDSPAAVVPKSSPWLAASLPSDALGPLAPAPLGRTLSGNFMTSESSWQRALPGRPLVPAPPTVLGPGLNLGLSSCRGVSMGPGARVPDPLPACRGIPPHPTIQPLPGTLVSGERGKRGPGKGSPTNDPTSSFLVRAQSQF